MQLIVGLDIGSGSLKAIVAELRKDGKVGVLKALKFPSDGIRRGMIEDLPLAARAISIALGEIKQISKDAVKNIYVSTGAPYGRIQYAKGIVAVSRADLQICADDITRAREAAESVKLPPNRMVVHALTEEFAVDDIGDIKDPLGMVGNRLEARSVIIDAFAPAVRNLARAVEVAGGSLSGMIFNPIAAAKSVLTRNQKDLGAVVVDIGFGTTGLAVYQEGKLIHTSSFHIGGGHVTNDIAIGLRTSIGAAEQAKFSFGSALAKEVPIREMIELSKFDATARGQVTRRFLSEIIESRLTEIFEFIHNDLRAIGRSGQLPAGAVLVGGGAKLPAIVDLAIQELRLPVRVGVPDVNSVVTETSDVSQTLEDPEYACALGLVHWGADKMAREDKGFGLMDKVRNLAKYFMP